MGAVYKNQTLLTLRFDTEADLTVATSPEILYIKPGGVKGSWAGTIDGTEIIYAVQTGDIVPGKWTFQVKYMIGTLIAYGEIVSDTFYNNIEA